MTGRTGGARIVLITGASSGIGLAAARAFAAKGDDVVLVSRSQTRLDKVAAQCRLDGAHSALAVATDVLHESKVDELFARVVAEYGRVDVVVHAAALMAYGSIEKVPADVFTTVVDTGLHGTFYVARAALAEFRRHHNGRLIIVNSLLGVIAAPEMGAYITAKWGQAGLIRVLQIETRDEKGITVSSVQPGGVNTPIYSQAANVTGRSAKPPLPIDQPQKVARAIVRCAEAPRPRVSVGVANPLIVLGFRLAPRVFDALVTPLLHLASLRKPGSTTASTGNVFEPVAAAESEQGPWLRKV